MISSAGDKHEKHAKLSRAFNGDWGRNELAIVGTTCYAISELSQVIIQSLPSYKIAYADAEHKTSEAAPISVLASVSAAFIEMTEKKDVTQIDCKMQPSSFQKRTILNDCDVIIVNGNHFTAAKQIVVIDERKPLEKKLDKLTNVGMILVSHSSAMIPDCLIQHLSNIDSIPRYSIHDTESVIRYISNYIVQQTPAINGLVLSGGQSTRMGRDKGDIHYHDKSQREYVFEMLSAHCEATFISCNAQQSEGIAGTRKIEDTFLNLGPLSGILSAFRDEPNKAWLTVACDLPFLNNATLDYLIRHRNPSKMATAFRDAEGRFPEPLVTIWEPRAYPVLLQFLAQGYSCPRKVLINSDVEILQAPDVSAFQNINTSDEYQQALIMLRK